MFAFKPHLFPLSLPLPLAEALQRGIPPFRASQNLLQTRHISTQHKAFSMLEKEIPRMFENGK